MTLASNVGAYAEPIAEHVVAMTLALARRLPQRHAALARGEFNQADPLLAVADVLVIALPLTTATRGLIGARELALMKDTAIVVIVSRAAIVDERALYEHLRAHPAFGAGIDAWWHEPGTAGPGSGFSTAYPFFGLPNVIGSPHNSGIVPGVLPSAARQAAMNVRRYLRGEAVTGLVNREDYR